MVGAGPVGLCLAGLLGLLGVRTLVLERRRDTTRSSRAIGVTPPSLKILDVLSVADPLVAQGIPVYRAYVHGYRSPLGNITFRDLPGTYPFILSVPQAITESVLVERVAAIPAVTVSRGVSVSGVESDGDDSVVVRTDGGYDKTRAAFVCGCDGPGSTVRSALGTRFTGRGYRRYFVMGDYRDRSGLGLDAHLWFTPFGAVESFPLPNATRRWIVQTRAAVIPPVTGLIEELVHQRAGIPLSTEDLRWQSSFQPERYRSGVLSQGRVLLCGDAAHVMAPIGAQGMNTGFADAMLAARLIASHLRRSGVPPSLGSTVAPSIGEIASLYERFRRPAVRAATARAAASMRVGTITGKVPSLIRNAAVRAVLATPARRALPPHFAMLTIPHGDTTRVSIDRP